MTMLKKLETVGMVAGRALMGLFYIIMGANHFIQTESMVQYAAAMGMPLASVAVLLTGLLLIFAGITLLLGLHPELGIAALVLFFLPVSFIMHPFWAVPDAQTQAEMASFTKNLALMGTALALLAVPRPWPVSIDARRERAVQQAAEQAAG